MAIFDCPEKFIAIMPTLKFKNGKLCSAKCNCLNCYGPIRVTVDGVTIFAGFTELDIMNPPSRIFSGSILWDCGGYDCGGGGLVGVLTVGGRCVEVDDGTGTGTMIESWNLGVSFSCGMLLPGDVPIPGEIIASSTLAPKGNCLFEKPCEECGVCEDVQLWTADDPLTPENEAALLCSVDLELCSLFQGICLINQTDITEEA